MLPSAHPAPLPWRRRLLLGGAGFLVARAAGAQTPSGPALTDVLETGKDIHALRAVAVMRDGQLLAQRAYGGGSVETLFRINSATKSVSAVLVGSTIAQGKLGGLSQTLGELLPDAAAANPGSAAAGVTLGQVLTGTTGLKFDWMTEFRALATATDPVRYAFQLPREGPTGASWTYNDAAVGLLSPILERARGIALTEIARQDLFGPLGIDAFEWQRDRAGRPTSYAGLRLRVADLAKLAWLMADGGQWQGKRVLPADWVAQSTRQQVGRAWPNPPITDAGYGFLWFTGRYKDVPVAWAWGYGAQFALAAPSLRLAVATAATEPPPQQLPAQNAAVAGLVARILDAFG
ncbi:serine hydrolase [uncultured Ramlibacter sp.]|uniref:serine hydrolase domain-containing protein n=1 Tax=uncultured Ramlibacter sp. TaxID=260755 RepID=UPI002635D010|nr:serine hydrolase domain-containing protein [uncultured Ramlibacter sp.]